MLQLQQYFKFLIIEMFHLCVYKNAQNLFDLPQ